MDVWYPEGTDIEITQQKLEAFEDKIASYDGVTHVTSQIGGSSPRFLLTYTPEQPYGNFARILVDVNDYKIIGNLSQSMQNDLDVFQPDARVNVRLFVLGPATGGKVQLRISGPDREVLRELAAKATNVLHESDNVKGLRDEWDEKVKVIRPRMSEAQARQLGVDRTDIASAVAYAVEGVSAGVYREGDELLPIVARAPAIERSSLNNLTGGRSGVPRPIVWCPLGQVVTEFDVEFEDAHIWRQDRVSMLRLHFDQRTGLSSELLAEVKGDVEKALGVDVNAYFDYQRWVSSHDSSTIKIKYRDRLPIEGMPGYYMAWGGENEDSDKVRLPLPVPSRRSLA